IDQDMSRAWKGLAAPAEHEEARLRRDHHAHLVGHFQPGATDELLLLDEDLDVSLELAAQPLGKAAQIRNAPIEDRAPLARKRPCAPSVAPQLQEPRPRHHPGDEERDEA